MMIKLSNLTIVERFKTTTGEIGDTWIYGIGSDPEKMSAFRSAMRAFSACIKAGECSPQDPKIGNFSRMLAKAGEHTW